MVQTSISVLIVEDSPVDLTMTRELLLTMPDVSVRLDEASTMARALALLDANRYDVVLLDLNLPDSRGHETLASMTRHADRAPFIVTTGLGDVTLALKAVQMGAQDYLVKGRYDGDLLARSIRYALERRRLQAQVEAGRVKARGERELAFLERLSNDSMTSVTARLLDVVSLRESLPEKFQEFVAEYGIVLDQGVEQRIYKINHDVTKALRLLADRLAFVKAGPRDVIEIHSQALKARSETANYAKFGAYLEEARLVVLELMGDLMAIYRNQALGVWPATGQPEAPPPQAHDGRDQDEGSS